MERPPHIIDTHIGSQPQEPGSDRRPPRHGRAPRRAAVELWQPAGAGQPHRGREREGRGLQMERHSSILPHIYLIDFYGFLYVWTSPFQFTFLKGFLWGLSGIEGCRFLQMRVFESKRMSRAISARSSRASSSL